MMPRQTTSSSWKLSGSGRFGRVPFVVKVTAGLTRPPHRKESPAMRYALLIYTEEPTQDVPDEVMAAEFGEYAAFTALVRERGAYEAGEALQPTATATTVRVVDGQTVATDGPFAETKEALGGFYLIDASDLDAAIDYAARIPGARHGSIEIRPIYEMAASGRDARPAEAAAAN
jgi:hypothetical protein